MKDDIRGRFVPCGGDGYFVPRNKENAKRKNGRRILNMFVPPSEEREKREPEI